MRPRTRLLWLTGAACNGNAHSFLNYPEIGTFLEDFEFVHHSIIDSPYTLHDVARGIVPCDILLIEGTVSHEHTRAGVPMTDIIAHYAKQAYKIVTVGTCATFGGIFKESYPDGSGLLFHGETPLERFEHLSSKTVSVAGCPIHPEVLAGTLYALRDAIKLELDAYHRPKDFFAWTIHNGCTRNEYFEYKVDNHRFGEKEGCMFYDHGCAAPYTHGSCNKILWNGVNSKTRAGLPCMGCTEPFFPREGFFQTKKHMGIPQYLPLGVAKRTYLTLAGITKAFKIKRLEQDLYDD